MIALRSSGSFKSTEEFLQSLQAGSYLQRLEQYGEIGVNALKDATPIRTDETAQSWSYEIVDRPGYFSIRWKNDHAEAPSDTPVAVLIQYGHGTRNGGYVQGIDYINPAMRPIFDQIVEQMWKEVTSGHG
jgi:hypothetical protein